MIILIACRNSWKITICPQSILALQDVLVVLPLPRSRNRAYKSSVALLEASWEMSKMLIPGLCWSNAFPIINNLEIMYCNQ